VNTFERDGARYVVLREDLPFARAFESLTSRERQVVLHAALGFTNKEIAYSLGISDSTVRVLVARAVRRIGVRSRAELLSHPSVQQARAERRTDAETHRNGAFKP
jgi:DNA-binding NarL/FixJ family response regulator